MTERHFLPYARQCLDEVDIAAVIAVLKGDWLTCGPAGPAFERAIAERLGCRHAVACASGTAALHLAYLGLDLGPGDAVIVPAITFLATANAARMTGAEAVFADVDPLSGLLTVATAAEAIARARKAGLRVKAIVPVHLAGQAPDIEALATLAAAERIVIIEDACHALGSLLTGTGVANGMVGNCAASLMTIFSLHAVKTIGAGEGGAVTTNDAALKSRLDRLRNHGADRGAAHDAQPWLYEMRELGYNYRLSDMQAALAHSQLQRLTETVDIRRDLVERYDAHFAAGSPARPIRRTGNMEPAWHLYPVLIDFDGLGIGRGIVMKALAEEGIGTQVHYIPVHRQPYYAGRPGGAPLAGADAYYARTLSLPLHCAMTLEDADRVAGLLLNVLAEAKTRLPSAEKIAA